MKLLNIPFTEYLALPDKSKYSYAFRYSMVLKEPMDLFDFGSLLNYKFGQVKEIQDRANTEGISWEWYIELIEKIKGVKSKDIAQKPVFDLWRARVHLIKEVEALNKLEQNLSSKMPSGKEVAAGIEKFSEYKSFLQYDALTGGDITKIPAIEETDYLTCFVKLKLEADRADYSEKLNKLK